MQPPEVLTACVREGNQREKPRSLKAARRRTTERISKRRNRPHGNLQGKSLPSAPTGQPKTAQGEALRFDVPNDTKALKGRTNLASIARYCLRGAPMPTFQGCGTTQPPTRGMFPRVFVGRGLETPRVSAPTQRSVFFAKSCNL
jgi:hypothetical protein